MKKGVIEVQFNWIFVLIVGAVILAFFVSIVVKQKDLSSGRIGTKLATDLETITTGAEVSKGTAQLIKIPNTVIEFQSPDCVRSYSIGGWNKMYREKLMFAPSRIEGRDLLAWTLDWSLPYRVTNFLFLTSPYMRYIIVANAGDELAKRVNRTLPTEMYRDFTEDPNTINNQNNYMVRLVFFSNDPDDVVVPNSLEDMDNRDVSALHVLSTYPYETGQVRFYVKRGDVFDQVEQNVSFMGIESLYGAVFTDDRELFVCNMRSAFKKMCFVTDIIQNRTATLLNDFSSSSCSNDYFLSLDGPLRNLYSNATYMSGNYGGASEEQVQAIYAAAVQLGQHNNNLEMQSCPDIY
jgi:hypothetical protein